MSLIRRLLIQLAKLCLRLAGESPFDIDQQFEIFYKWKRSYERRIRKKNRGR